MSGRPRSDPFPEDRFPFLDPESPAASRWRALHEAGDAEALAAFEEVVAGPPGFCTSGWRSEEDASDHFPHVRPDSRVADAWRRLRDLGDGRGLMALEEALEQCGSAAEVRALRFCRCGCGRLDLAQVLEEPRRR